ncbi:MAG: NTP transferase domain-containing protein [Acidimicrobiales bacterium]|jgi:bifunctional UDP-N-acetylglucosamine pyrophosphorylase/glucosamine-1-phosphate N-acetyltransferase
MNHRPLSVIVLAAGEGTRMRSATAKPLHRLCGRPMILYVLDALGALSIERVAVVVGHGVTEVVKIVQAEAPQHLAIEFVEQFEPRGTGDAVAVALTGLSGTSGAADFDEGDVVVVPGDMPLLSQATLASLVEGHRASEGAATLLSAGLDHPDGYSRIIRDKDGRVARIVDEPDATEPERQIGEVATNVYCFRHGVLAPALRRLSPYNSLGEYYLTDTVAVLHDAGYTVTTVMVPDPVEALEVNDRAQLAAAEAELRARINRRWMRRGVTMWDPERTYLDASVRLAADVTLLPGVILEGTTTVGSGAVLGPSVHLVDCEVAPGAKLSHTVGSHAVIGEQCSVGPYVVLEKGTRLARGERRGPSFTPGSGGAS